MTNAPMSAQAFLLARWEVRWVSGKGKIVVKDCGTDFHEAKRIYGLAVQARKKAATLRCKNVAFPPPDKYYRKPMAKVERVNGKKVKRVVHVSIIGRLNRKGIWWCPYCIEMRRFVQRNGWDMDGTYVKEPHLACPMCGIAHTSSPVRNYNPLADRIVVRHLRKRRRRRV